MIVDYPSKHSRKMQHELLRDFAKENFGPRYYVVPQGHSTPFQPLTLIVKENRALCRLRNRRMVVMDPIDSYLVENAKVQSEVAQLTEKHLNKGEKQQIDNIMPTRSSFTLTADWVDETGLTAKHHVDYGTLDLGKVQEEFYTDMGLRSLLAKAKIDRAKMQPYEKRKLYLITGVVYSTKLQIGGERERTDELDATIAWPRFSWFKTKLSILARTEPPPALGRRHRSPLLFKYAKVKYDPDQGILELKEMVGARLKKTGMGIFEDVVADSESEVKSTSSVKCFVTREDLIFEDLMESTVSDPYVKMTAISSILQDNESFEATRNRMTKYMDLATKVLAKNGKEVTVDDLLTAQDNELLQSMGIEVFTSDPNTPATLKVTQGANKDNLQDFVRIFQVFLDMDEKEWTQMKAFVEKDKDQCVTKPDQI